MWLERTSRRNISDDTAPDIGRKVLFQSTSFLFVDSLIEFASPPKKSESTHKSAASALKLEGFDVLIREVPFASILSERVNSALKILRG